MDPITSFSNAVKRLAPQQKAPPQRSLRNFAQEITYLNQQIVALQTQIDQLRAESARTFEVAIAAKHAANGGADQPSRRVIVRDDNDVARPPKPDNETCGGATSSCGCGKREEPASAPFGAAAHVCGSHGVLPNEGEPHAIG